MPTRSFFRNLDIPELLFTFWGALPGASKTTRFSVLQRGLFFVTCLMKGVLGPASPVIIIYLITIRPRKIPKLADMSNCIFIVNIVADTRIKGS